MKKNLLLALNAVEKKAMPNMSQKIKRATRIAAVSVALAYTLSLPLSGPHAQKRDAPPNVTGISSRRTARGQVITISTDGPVSGTQTWQDPNGKFNIVLPGAGNSQVNGGASGVAVRKFGNSLGIEVPTRPGANVTVQPRANGVDLVIEGGDLETPKNSSQGNAQMAQQAAQSASSNPRLPVTSSNRWNAPSESRSATSSSSSLTSSSENRVASQAPQTNAAKGAPATSSPQPNSSMSTSAPPPASTNSATTPAQAPPAAQAPTDEDGGFTSYIFSYTGLGVLLVLGLGVFLVLRRRSEGGWENVEEDKNEKAKPVANPFNMMTEETERTGERRKRDRRKGSAIGRRSTDATEALVATAANAPQTVEGREVTMESRQNVLVPTALYGAYRVDQEIGKLLLGQPHRIDVLVSRAPDDRRAMEASLLKALDAAEIDEDGKRRARTALEEYGFVARQSAALLLAPNAYERASAARILGEVQSPSSLPFLLEALYDSEQIVRTHAVTSIGSLKLPSAIGALLDMARRYPDMPSNLISRALSACSVESLDFMDGLSQGSFFLNAGDDAAFTGEITALEPATNLEALPEWLEDESLAEALERLASSDVEARTAAAQSLGQYPVQRSVDALTALASQDPEPSVRAAAVTSLAIIDHESVFASILMAFADESREVRAAAARALSRLNINRADAYVRLIDSLDASMLGNVARACINAGMAKQAMDRLGCEDRRQAYESFTLAALLAKAGETAPILQAIREHTSEDARLGAIRVLGMFAPFSVLQDLRELAVTDGIPEAVRMALMEVVYKIDQGANQQEDYSAVQLDTL